MLPIVLSAGAASALVVVAKRSVAKPPPPGQPQASVAADLPMAFLAFIMFVALFHWLGVGAGSTKISGGGSAYEDVMIANIAEDCMTGVAPF
jgi:hypothetical protein